MMVDLIYWAVPQLIGLAMFAVIMILANLFPHTRVKRKPHNYD